MFKVKHQNLTEPRGNKYFPFCLKVLFVVSSDDFKCVVYKLCINNMYEKFNDLYIQDELSSCFCITYFCFISSASPLGFSSPQDKPEPLGLTLVAPKYHNLTEVFHKDLALSLVSHWFYDGAVDL